MSLTLYYHPLSSYCHKVLIALYEHDIAFDARLINLGDAADRETLAAHWPHCKFPVLQDHARGRTLPESSVIIEYLDQRCATTPSLMPRSLDKALQVRLWDRFFDLHVQGPLQAFVIDKIQGTQRDMSSARATLQTSYGLIDKQLGEAPWVASPAFSLADCAAAPALFYTSMLEPMPPQLRHLHAYYERLMNRPSVARVLEEAKPYFHLFPFEDLIPARFR
jgi:glutathione S-transferase